MGKNRISAKTRRMTTGAAFVALGVILLWLGAVVEVLDLSLAAIASVLTVMGVIEFGSAFPWLVWGATSLLSLLILPAKFPALLYFLFMGLYPMLKAIFERQHYIIAWILKLSAFNTALLLLIVLCTYVFALPDTGLAFEAVVFALANGAFVLYDIALSRLILLYLFKLRPRFRLNK
ncbi:MAG: hypothetical protein IJF49_04605 [Clostridia bacterium]|nr:hypothetical protein [Clostridia bacterium]